MPFDSLQLVHDICIMRRSAFEPFTDFEQDHLAHQHAIRMASKFASLYLRGDCIPMWHSVNAA